MKKRFCVNNVIVISDLHLGCQFGLCPREGLLLDSGGVYKPSKLQEKVWDMWEIFWNEWVPNATQKEPFAVVINGDVTDGRHHNSVSQISQNLSDQERLAIQVLTPVVNLCQGRFYITRGTEAHTGPSGENEEKIAVKLEAIPDDVGLHSRFELWLKVGKGLVHCMHHIGTTGSSHYESSAVMKELTEAYAEAGRWRRNPPDVVVRSHRHRHIEIRVPTELGYGISFCTAGWQLKTPFTYKIPGGRTTTPQFGGSLIRQGDEDLFTRHKTWSIERPKIEVL